MPALKTNGSTSSLKRESPYSNNIANAFGGGGAGGLHNSKANLSGGGSGGYNPKASPNKYTSKSRLGQNGNNIMGASPNLNDRNKPKNNSNFLGLGPKT